MNGQGQGEVETRQFAFVLERRQQGIRSHAMREYWKQRHRKQHQERRKSTSHIPSFKTLLPSLSPEHVQAVSDEGPSQYVAIEPEPENNSNSINRKDISLESTQPEVGDRLASLIENSDAVSGERGSTSFVDGIPAQLLAGVNQAIASTRLGPFDAFPVKLTPQHHKLLHHWFSTYSTMMFDQAPSGTFNPMRDVSAPIAMSNAASFNMVLAHSAAHIASMRGYKECKEALKFKTEAVHIVKEWLGNPEYALNDDLLAAILGLQSYERSWGVEADWRLHKDGIERMISARGGISSFHANWRLQLVTFLASIASKPSWFDSSNRIAGLPRLGLNDENLPIEHDQECPLKIRSLWLVSLMEDLRNFTAGRTVVDRNVPSLGQCVNIQMAVLLLRNDLKGQSLVSDNACRSHELQRLTCVFLISILLQESGQKSQSNAACASEVSQNSLLSDLALLDIFLEGLQDLWQFSIPELHAVLLENTLRLPGGSYKMEYAMDMANILGFMSVEARYGVEKCLVNFLCQWDESDMVSSLDAANDPEYLLSSSNGL